MLLCIFLLMCLKLLSNAVRDIGLASRREELNADSTHCTTINNQTGLCLDRQSCLITNQSSMLNYSDTCAQQRGSSKFCCPISLRRSTNNTKLNNVRWAECGVSNRTLPYVVGGHNASLGDWPWMVALYYKRNGSSNLYFQCGGSLISERWVITAAHCIRNVSGTLEPSVARLGDLNLDESVEDEANPLDIFIDEIIPHPNYSQSPIVNDIALLHLQETVPFSDNIRPICLLSGFMYQKDSFYSRKRPYVIGWGRSAFNNSLTAVLQETSIGIVNTTECAQMYAFQPSARIDDTVLCAGGGGKDSCQGDSGGPLMLPNSRSKTFHLAGIVSYGIRCADHFPGVYTRVAAFTDWISNITGSKF